MAYAAVISLMQTLTRLTENPEPQTESLLDKLCPLFFFLTDNFPVPNSYRSSANDLEIQITEAVYGAQDLVDSFIFRQNLASESPQVPADQTASTLLFSQRLQDVTARIDLVAEKAEKMAHSIAHRREDNERGELSENYELISYCSPTKIVGQEEIFSKLQSQLLDDTDLRPVISITGMPGIGKTILAKSIYDDQRIFDHFTYRAWATVSPEYDIRDILLKILRSVETRGQKRRWDHLFHKMMKSSEVKLRKHLFQKLENNRYLIVMDDVWDKELLYNLKRSLPENQNGSRFVLTTSNEGVAFRGGNPPNEDIRNKDLCDVVHIPFLDAEESWTLIHNEVFTTEESCNHQLEKIGRQIAKNCQGLPSSIIEVGKILCKEKTIKYWKQVVGKEDSLIFKTDNTPILKALYVSYTQLPIPVKACLLYMGGFPHNCEIPIAKLINLWAAEGFLGLSDEKNLEERAMLFLKDLVSKNLVLVGEKSSTGDTKTCRIHFVTRNLCNKEAHKVKFFHVINNHANSFPESADSQRRLCIHNNSVLGFKQVHSKMKSVRVARSLLCFGPQQEKHPIRLCLRFRLLRLLDALTIRFYEFPHQILKQVHLRYLAITYDGEIPASISRLVNLVVLIVHQHHCIKSNSRDPVNLPMEIWKLHRLRHLECMGADLPDPSTAARGNNNKSLILKELVTLKGVSARSCTQGVLERIPHLLKLGIHIDSTDQAAETFSDTIIVEFYVDQLQRLKAFKFTVVNPIPGQRIDFLPKLIFPKTLLKLSLSGCGLPWDGMTVIGQLPCLKVLKLRDLAFEGPEWKPEYEFRNLKFLLLEYLDLAYWDTDGSHFPKLERLIIKHCYELEEIPSGIGHLENLEFIELTDCNASAVDSAEDIKKEQKSYGNDRLQVRICSSYE